MIANALKCSSDEKEQVRNIHGPSHPDSVYSGAHIEAKISYTVDDKKHSITLPVWRISPLGIELKISNEHSAEMTALSTGNMIDLVIYLSKEKCEFKGIVIKSVVRINDYELLGIRWCEKEDDDKKNKFHLEQRFFPRWLCGIEFLPSGIVANPYKFNDFIHFQVRDISPNGMQIVTSLRNKYLVPGMTLESMISFPMVAQIKVDLKICNVRITTSNGKDYLALGTKMISEDKKMKEVIGQYVFQFGSKTSIEELKKWGLQVNKASDGVEFSYVRTEDDFLKVLKLRKLAYAGAGKIPADYDTNELADIFDTRSRIIMGTYRGQLVATARLIFHEEDDELEHERFMKLPKDFPRNDELIEVTRFCTHPDFRGSNLFYRLLQHIVLTTLQSKRRYLVSSATLKLSKVYQK